MDRSPDARERVVVWTVATALGFGIVTAFLPAGFWSTAPRGYVVGAVALTPGLLLGLVETGPALSRKGGVDPLLSAILAWLVGVAVVVHGEFVVALPGDPAPTTPLGVLFDRVGFAISGWLPLGVVGFVSGTVVRVALRLVESALGRLPAGQNA